ncbi:mucin-2 protein [Nocardioides sp.]|uniref:mucin-2 protein n=1 Tax=Nocardioides sp. TaxID=35761 RepID=UPI003783D51E
MADHRHKRDTDARRKPRAAVIAGPLALLATASAVTIGMLASNPASPVVTADVSADISGVFQSREVASRSGSRISGDLLQKEFDRNQDRLAKQAAAERAAERAARVATQRAVEQADEKLWTTTVLNLWTDAGSSATQVGEIDAGKQVLVTGRDTAGRTEIVVDGQSRWVTAGYLSDEKPVAAAAGLSMAPCPDGSVESGLVSDAVYVYRSVCHAFPQITSYGGWDAHGEHSSGKAIDIMTSDKELGDAIAEFLKAHASELNLYDVIWWDQIWTPVRASEGWRSYGDHGSPTANHMDHVHVSTN